jgi:hypothetical protein
MQTIEIRKIPRGYIVFRRKEELVESGVRSSETGWSIVM